MPALHTLMTGLAFGESPRWHDDRLWFSDMGTGEVVAVDRDGTSEVIARVPAMPMGTGWLPDGRMLIVSSHNGLVLRTEPGGSLVTHADLTGLAGHPWSDMAVDGGATPTSATSASTSAAASPPPALLPWSPPTARPGRSPATSCSPTALPSRQTTPR